MIYLKEISFLFFRKFKYRSKSNAYTYFSNNFSVILRLAKFIVVALAEAGVEIDIVFSVLLIRVS